ncbi:ArsR/SmtB family transcription factor [Halorubrum lacusprofundi]|uniref:ArsR/SmtB family transcription factor n=1 Tax=Halorubrum lacusprofundi TaxID=2247 RepID=UPI00373AE5C5
MRLLARRQLVDDRVGVRHRVEVGRTVGVSVARAINVGRRPDVELLSALGNETRYKIVRMLHAADGDELCVCELSPLLDVSDSAISHALSKLTDAGLVTRRKEGKWRMYRATPRANAVLVALDGSRSL